LGDRNVDAGDERDFVDGIGGDVRDGARVGGFGVDEVVHQRRDSSRGARRGG